MAYSETETRRTGDIYSAYIWCLKQLLNIYCSVYPGWGYPKLYPVSQEGPTGSHWTGTKSLMSCLSKNAATNQL